MRCGGCGSVSALAEGRGCPGLGTPSPQVRALHPAAAGVSFPKGSAVPETHPTLSPPLTGKRLRAAKGAQPCRGSHGAVGPEQASFSADTERWELPSQPGATKEAKLKREAVRGAASRARGRNPRRPRGVGGLPHSDPEGASWTLRGWDPRWPVSRLALQDQESAGRWLEAAAAPSTVFPGT